jgi:AAA15 family ATPase/GTPase
MIRSISFTGKGKEDYINAVRYKTVLKKGVTPEQYEEAKKSRAYRSYLNNMVKEVRDGYMNPVLRKCVLKHEFKFEPDKVNVIFGPNGSGKTTILKTIAEHCMCGSQSDGNDGYTSLTKYFRCVELFTWGEKDTSKEKEMERLVNLIQKKSGNEANVDWDGQAVYYENMAGRKTYNELGNLVGGLIESFAEEIVWHMEQKSSSAGQKTMYLISKLNNVLKKCPTPDQLHDENRALRAKSTRDYEEMRLDTILDYYMKYYVKTDDPYPTLLLDEMDKSLDLLNVMALYSEVLPAIQKHFHVQIIVVRHSPVILLDKIFKSDRYNIVSMSEKYTRECRKELKTLI